MTARLYIGDVFDRMAQLEDGTYDLIITSPPFLALRSYLPEDHPLKDKEIGSEATPAAFLDVMLALTARWGELLAPHGSIAIEIGDTYSGSGGAGGDYGPDGLRAGQPRANGSGRLARYNDQRGNPAGMRDQTFSGANTRTGGGDGWPLAKSLAMIPELYAASLAYGHNLLTGQPSPAGRWRVRNFKPWIRSNPPVGALGDKERPATSYITVACRAVDRYFDLDSVRTGDARPPSVQAPSPKAAALEASGQHGKGMPAVGTYHANGGAPPLDWWHPVDALIDNIIDDKAGKYNGGENPAGKPITEADTRRLDAANSGGVGDGNRYSEGVRSVGARGVHIRRALEAAGYIQTLDALDVSPKGYPGAHYAVWPPLLVKLLLQEMAPRRVCTTCGKPSRRITGDAEYRGANGHPVERNEWTSGIAEGKAAHSHKPDGGVTAHRPTVGWSDCGCCAHDNTAWTIGGPEDGEGWIVCTECGTPNPELKWRPARILDPFGGSGTTGAVATGLGIDCDLIDIDDRNADLARERIGMFLEVIERESVA